jgi:hypothetical protein
MGIIGPRRISQVNQVAIPVAVMGLMGLRAGDSVFFEVSDGPMPQVRLVPAGTAERQYAAGASFASREDESSDSPGVRSDPAGHRTTRASAAPGRPSRARGGSGAGS